MPASNQNQWTPRISQVSQNDQQRMQFIRSLMQDGRTAEAQAELQTIRQQEPQNTQVIMTLAMCHIQANQLEDAANCLEEIMRIDPKNRVAPLMAAHVGMRGENPEYSEKHFQKALKLDPTSIQALTGLARLHEQQKHPEKAIEMLTIALGVNPTSTGVRHQLARSLVGLGRVDEAQEHLEFALEANPGDVPTTMQLARLQSQNNKVDEAIKTVENSLITRQDSRRLLQLLGTLNISKGNYAEAERALAKALAGQEHRRQNGSVRLTMASALIPQKKCGEARAVLSQVHQRNLIPMVQRLYGDAYAVENRLNEAENSYRSALFHMPDGNEAVQRIEAAKAKLSPTTKEDLLEIYENEFKGVLENWQSRIQNRHEQGMSAEQRGAMFEQRHAHRQRRQAMMRRFAASRTRGGDNQPGSFNPRQF